MTKVRKQEPASTIPTVAKVWSAFSLGKLLHVKRYSSGQHNQTFKVITTEGIFSLRVYNYKKPSKISFEIALLNTLHGLPVPQLRKIGNNYYALLGKKCAIVYNYLPGSSLKIFTKRQLEEVGSFIAQLQKRGKTFHWNKKRYKFYHLPDDKIRHFVRIVEKAKLPHRAYLPRIVKELKENRLSNRLPEGPIHVDIKPENTLFYNGRLSGIIDFDNSYIGPSLLDLAKSMVWFGTRNKRFDVASALQVYTGYRKKKRLTRLEHAELYKAVKFAFLSHIFVDYYMRAIKVTSARYFDFIIHNLYAAYKSFTMTEANFIGYSEDNPSQKRITRSFSTMAKNILTL